MCGSKQLEEDVIRGVESVALGLPTGAAGPHLTEQGSPLVVPRREKTERKWKVTMFPGVLLDAHTVYASSFLSTSFGL